MPRSSTTRSTNSLTRRSALRRYTDLQQEIAEIAERYPVIVEQYYDKQRRTKARTKSKLKR